MTHPRIRFVIGGVQKAGTTALARYLDAHPLVQLPLRKEAHVFDSADFDDAWSVEQIDQRYRTRMPAARDEAIAGDATPSYLFDADAVARIARYNPAMRWIVLLRDPVERALSHYYMERRRGRERWPLWPALLLERWRLRRGGAGMATASPRRTFSYRARGDYAQQLDRLYARFPREHVLLLTSDELSATPAQCLQRVHAFLGLQTPAQTPAFTREFEGGYRRGGRYRLSRRLLRWLLRRERAQLRERYGIDFD